MAVVIRRNFHVPQLHDLSALRYGGFIALMVEVIHESARREQ